MKKIIFFLGVFVNTMSFACGKFHTSENIIVSQSKEKCEFHSSPENILGALGVVLFVAVIFNRVMNKKMFD